MVLTIYSTLQIVLFGPTQLRPNKSEEGVNPSDKHASITSLGFTNAQRIVVLNQKGSQQGQRVILGSVVFD